MASSTRRSVLSLVSEAASFQRVPTICRRTLATVVEAQKTVIKAAPLEESVVFGTVHAFPSLEPKGFHVFSNEFLGLPTRKDILHRAVIFEADGKRQGTASTKNRADVSYSGKKIRPQKHSGRARLGDRGSGMLRGGGRIHGPKPRDFSTELPLKLYNLAFRTALSTRYRMGELTIIDGTELPTYKTRVMSKVLAANNWDKPHGGALLVISKKTQDLAHVERAAANLGADCEVKEVEDLQVTDLLKWGRVVIEEEALLRIQERTTQKPAPRA
ncbi:54S ribosomal protein yml6, mitochondrial [Saitoella coloradoensis]